ncbi:hypothetical protein [Egbenema bharatensis]|uniref:hypothetical protein n=1 Tax=Egbenema bharatensis TaxID=3463334 RepID=UPI003A857811
MLSPRWRRALAAILLSLVLFVSACSAQEPSRYTQIQEETSGRNAPAAVSDQAARGGDFNKYFPRSVAGYNIVPYQEKNGFAEYKVNQDGKNVAMLAINDVLDTPAAYKFQNSAMTIAGYPAVEQGQTATAILVNDRYQVKVLSRDSSFTKEDRAAWIEKFDLAGLSELS